MKYRLHAARPALPAGLSIHPDSASAPPAGRLTYEHKMSERKRKGEWAELLFMARAAALGFTVSKPMGDSARYDAIIEKNGFTLRIQVKCVGFLWRTHYRISCATGIHSNRRYTTEEADFLAAYIIPEDTWYIIPIAAVAPYTVVYVRPHREAKSTTFEQFREAWPLLEPPKDRARPGPLGPGCPRGPRRGTSARAGAARRPGRRAQLV